MANFSTCFFCFLVLQYDDRCSLHSVEERVAIWSHSCTESVNTMEPIYCLHQSRKPVILQLFLNLNSQQLQHTQPTASDITNSHISRPIGFLSTDFQIQIYLCSMQGLDVESTRVTEIASYIWGRVGCLTIKIIIKITIPNSGK